MATKVKLRRITSLVLFLCGATLLTTSLILYATPQGRVAYWSGWTLAGLSKDQWTRLHINLGLLLLLAGVLHAYLNWGPITSYLKNRSKRLVIFTGEFAIALVITVVALVGTQLALPPLQWSLDLNEAIKDRASARYGEPPYGHAELSTLRTFCRRLDLDLEVALEQLAAAGYEVRGPEATLLEIAEAHGVTPQVVYEAMQVAEGGESESHPVLSRFPAPGTGKKRLVDFCAEYGLDLEEIVGVLAAEGVEAVPEQTLREIAAAHGSAPDELYEIIRLSQQSEEGAR